MKRIISILFVFIILSGCGDTVEQLDRMLKFRQNLLSGSGCRFSCEVTADYGDELYQFTMDCQGDEQGNLSFSVTAPESISGITGAITEAGGHLTFDGTALAFEPIADGQLSPVTAPWVFLKTLRSGYIASSAKTEGGIYLQINDSYRNRALHLDIWMDENQKPVCAEILWEGRRVLSIRVKDFIIL